MSRTVLSRPRSVKRLTTTLLVAASAPFFQLALPAIGAPQDPAPARSAAVNDPPLSKAQKDKIAALRAKLENDLEDLRGRKNISEKARKTAFEKLESDYAVNVTALLTPAQKAAIHARMDTEAELRKRREAEFRDVTTKILALSDDVQGSLTTAQKKQIAAAKKDMREKASAVYADKSLSKGMQNQKITQIERDLEKSVNDILTDDQRQKFAQIQDLEQRQFQLINGGKPK